MAKEFNAPKGSVVVFDKGFKSHEWHNTLTKKEIYWATRIRGNAKYDVIKEREFVINDNVLGDQVIQYMSMQRRKEKLLPIRLIKYRDHETGKDYEFITNHFGWSAQTIADIYK